MKFKVITLQEANDIVNNINSLYSPAYLVKNDGNHYCIYTAKPDVTNVGTYLTLTEQQAYGLTPLNPNKPMFPKKK